jgi:predicted DNA-binding transcriptional regulator AlpA
LAHLGRLADLHAELAETIRTVAREAQNELAGSPDSRLMVSVNGSHLEAPDGATNVVLAKRLLSAHDVAEIVGVDAKTIRRWRNEGRMPRGLDFGGIVRWRPETIDAWLEDLEEDQR